ncbi:hypothetical protein [Pseudomonas sp. PA15(2017)]|uniref:hypothetical protein n=1 Tax=Pseudomonas sp. PA15(2017) TaxID=1932111 RepID=UPI001179AD51|nr:hypothetical protein [Pseudomonas sp. PA15(2017)]
MLETIEFGLTPAQYHSPKDLEIFCYNPSRKGRWVLRQSFVLHIGVTFMPTPVPLLGPAVKAAILTFTITSAATAAYPSAMMSVARGIIDGRSTLS